METSALSRQIAGTHYKGMKIQPAEYAVANNLGPLEHLIIKYISRWRLKEGFVDLDKIIHVCELIKELETKYNVRGPDQETSTETQPYLQGFERAWTQTHGDPR